MSGYFGVFCAIIAPGFAKCLVKRLLMLLIFPLFLLG